MLPITPGILSILARSHGVPVCLAPSGGDKPVKARWPVLDSVRGVVLERPKSFRKLRIHKADSYSRLSPKRRLHDLSLHDLAETFVQLTFPERRRIIAFINAELALARALGQQSAKNGGSLPFCQEFVTTMARFCGDRSRWVNHVPEVLTEMAANDIHAAEAFWPHRAVAAGLEMFRCNAPAPVRNYLDNIRTNALGHRPLVAAGFDVGLLSPLAAAELRGRLPPPNMRSLMPALERVVDTFRASQPFRTISIIACQHILPTTQAFFEALVELGLKPEHCTILGKPTSLDREVYNNLLLAGFDMCPEGLEETRHLVDPTELSKDVLKYFLKRHQQLNNAGRILAIDEGGTLGLALQSLQVTDVVGVEQTAGGIEKLRQLQQPLHFPVLNVAYSDNKRRLEGPIIARDVFRAFFRDKSDIDAFLKLPESMRVTVLGYGCIGENVAKVFKAAGYAICVYEPDPVRRARAIDHGCIVPTGDLHSMRIAALQFGQVILGCAACTPETPALHESEYKLLQNGTVLYNCASGNHQFGAPSVDRLLQAENTQKVPSQSLKGHFALTFLGEQKFPTTIVLANAGFPGNLVQKIDLPPSHADVTRATMLVASIQAATDYDALTPGLVDVSRAGQELVAASLDIDAEIENLPKSSTSEWTIANAAMLRLKPVPRSAAILAQRLAWKRGGVAELHIDILQSVSDLRPVDLKQYSDQITLYDHHGRSALHLAYMTGNLALAEELKAGGVDASKRDNDGFLAADYRLLLLRSFSLKSLDAIGLRRQLLLMRCWDELLRYNPRALSRNTGHDLFIAQCLEKRHESKDWLYLGFDCLIADEDDKRLRQAIASRDHLAFLRALCVGNALHSW